MPIKFGHPSSIIIRITVQSVIRVCYSRLLFKQRPLVVDEGIKCVK